MTFCDLDPTLWEGQRAGIGPADEGIGIDRRLGQPGLGQVPLPGAGEEGGGVGHRLGRPVEALDQRLGMRLGAFDPDHQRGPRERGQDRVAGIGRVDPFADRPAGIADEVRIAVKRLRPVDRLAS